MPNKPMNPMRPQSRTVPRPMANPWGPRPASPPPAAGGGMLARSGLKRGVPAPPAPPIQAALQQFPQFQQQGMARDAQVNPAPMPQLGGPPPQAGGAAFARGPAGVAAPPPAPLQQIQAPAMPSGGVMGWTKPPVFGGAPAPIQQAAPVPPPPPPQMLAAQPPRQRKIMGGGWQ